ncbi:MAG: FAD-linked oxidase C-terminal domain-containing protein [Thermodesulfobacteriota bacterium]
MVLAGSIIAELVAIVGQNNCTTREEDLHCYSFDGSKKQSLPDCLLFVSSAQQVSNILKVANSHKIPVVARGSGSGMTGGAVATHGGIVLAMAAMDQIVEIDKDNQVAIVEPGVINQDLQTTLKPLGLFYPPDPASMAFCTIGGNVALCAGGPSAVKYGVTKDHVLGLEVVLADGRIIHTGTRTEKGVVGYDLTRLFIGSEGTLGIITRITVRLTTAPECTRTYLVQSPDLSLITTLVAKILNQGITPRTLEYLDQRALSVVGDMLDNSFPKNTRGILILELDGDAGHVDQEEKQLLELLNHYDQITVDRATTDHEVAAIWQARRSVSPAAFNHRPNKISEDVAIPRSRIPQLVEFTEQLNGELSVIIFTFGHAGDGNIHVNIMYDRSEPDQCRDAETARLKIFEKTVALEGTLSGEHGVGLTKSSFINMELDQDTLALSRELKSFLDPNNILNPGKIFPAKVENSQKTIDTL